MKKGLSARAAATEINDVERTGTVNELVAQNWFKDLKEDDTRLKDKPTSGRQSVAENEILPEMVE